MHDITPEDIQFCEAYTKTLLKNWKIPRRLWEDCVQEAMLGMVKSAPDFDSGLNNNFRNYVKRSIRWALSNYLEKEIQHFKNIINFTDLNEDSEF